MGTLINGYLAGVSDFAAPFLLKMFIEATVLLIAACLAVRLIRPASAALRHRVWSTAFGCLLLLPLVSLLLPDIRLPIFPLSETASPSATTSPLESMPVASERGEPVDSEVSVASLEWLYAASAPQGMPLEPALPPAGFQAPEMELVDLPASPAIGWSAWSLPWQASTFAVWLVGLVSILVSITVGLARNRALVRTAEPIVDPDTLRLFSELRRRLGVKRNPRLLETDKRLVPMTGGIWRPVVLVPSVCKKWSYERRRIVLLHELAHVKRWDTLCQLAAKLACAVYWLHPLVWYSLRHLRAEREMACDDCVLMAGERPSNYAGHLLDIVRDYRSTAMVAAVTMAQPKGLEERVRAILDKTRSRLPISPAARIALLAGAASLLVGLAMAGPNASEPWQPGTAVSAVSSRLPSVKPCATLSGHSSGIWLVGFVDKGKKLISAGRDGAVKLWDLSGNEELSTWATNDRESESADPFEVYSAALSPDGRMLAVGGSNSVITLCDVTSGEKLRALEGHKGAILALAFSPDGKTLVSGGIDRILRLWNTETGEPVHEGYGGNSFRIQAVAVGRDGEIIVSGDRDNVVKFWRLHEQKYLSSVPPDGSVLALACAPKNNGLAAGLDHGRIVIWTGGLGAPAQRQVLSGHRGDITALAFTPDGEVLASASIDGRIKLWDVARGREMASVRAHPGGVRCLAMSADGGRLVTGGDDKKVKVWDMARLKAAGPPARVKVQVKEPERPLKVARYEALTTARVKMLDGVFLAEGSGGSWSPDAAQLAFGTSAGGIAVVDLKTGRQRALVEQGRDPAWSPRENVIAYVRGEPGEEEICIRNESQGKTVRLADGLAPAWSPDGTTLYYTGRDGTLNAVSWLPDGEPSQPRAIARDVRGRPAVSPDGQHVAYFDGDRLVTIDCRSGQVSTSRQVLGDLSAPAWSPDGRRIACAGHDSGLQIFDSTGRPAMHVIRSRVARPAWSPDGEKIAFDVTVAERVEIWMLDTEVLASLQAFHTAHHPEESPAHLDVKAPFEPRGKLVPLDLALRPDPRFPAGALGNPLDDLGDLPRGEQTLAGVTFQIGERPIQLGSEYQPQAPERVVGIPVQRKVARLYVLHGAGYADP